MKHVRIQFYVKFQFESTVQQQIDKTLVILLQLQDKINKIYIWKIFQQLPYRHCSRNAEQGPQHRDNNWIWTPYHRMKYQPTREFVIVIRSNPFALESPALLEAFWEALWR